MRIPIKWGLLLALVLTLWTAVVHLLGIYTTRVRYANIVDQVVVIVPLVMLTLAILEQRRAADGQLSFWRGVLTGVGVAAVSAVPTVAALWVYHHFVNPEWVSYLTTWEQQKLTAAGAAPAEIAARVTQLQQGGTDRQQIIGGLVGTIGMGLVLSLIIAGVVRALPVPKARV